MNIEGKNTAYLVGYCDFFREDVTCINDDHPEYVLGWEDAKNEGDLEILSETVDAIFDRIAEVEV